MIGSIASQAMKMNTELGPDSGAEFAHSILELTTAFVDDFLGRHGILSPSLLTMLAAVGSRSVCCVNDI